MRKIIFDYITTLFPLAVLIILVFVARPQLLLIGGGFFPIVATILILLFLKTLFSFLQMIAFYKWLEGGREEDDE